MNFLFPLHRDTVVRAALIGVMVTVPAAHALAATDIGDALPLMAAPETIAINDRADYAELHAALKLPARVVESLQTPSTGAGGSDFGAARPPEESPSAIVKPGKAVSAFIRQGAEPEDLDGKRDQTESLFQLVANKAGFDVDSDEEHCLASAVYFEAKGESLAGQLAVAKVILNRLESGRFASRLCGVVLQPSQFSFVRRGRIPAIAASTAWSRAVGVARVALEGLADSPADKALYFHARTVRPGWGRPHVVTLGNHIFYR